MILEKLDGFMSDVGAAMGDEVLAEAYQFYQRKNEEVATFVLHLDNHVRMARSRGTELLPDDDAVLARNSRRNLKIKPDIKKIYVKPFQSLSQQRDTVKRRLRRWPG